ncbi:MAG TPA: permease-like cell division protein FtsX, partial [Candidatus Paceibacterota bacterium]
STFTYTTLMQVTPWTTIKRIFRTGFLNFWRNGFVTLSSILMMTITLFTLGLVVFSGVVLNTTLQNLRDKADINVYFTTTAPEDQILALQQTLQARPDVSSVSYTSREDELAAFRDRHQNDQLTLQALDELGGNPLGAVLTIKAKDITQYDAIAQFLEGQQGVGNSSAQSPSIIDKINYFDAAHRAAIDKLQSITDSAERIGLVVILILSFATIAISFNTVRLAIYTSRDEIAVMQLVGAARSYIRAPFMVEAVMYGLFAGLFTLVLYYPITYWLGQQTSVFFGDLNVFSYYMEHFFFFFMIIVGAGMAIGAIASLLAVRRYLKL